MQAYLDLVDRQEASAHQLAALGNFLADAGMLEEAMAYYSVALKLEKEDPLLWVNLGTLHMKRGEFGDAIDANARALSLDRNNAMAHYNLGVALDARGNYDDAIAEYKMALTLDPTLGDPKTNPSAVNNSSLMVVKLLLYQEQAGRAGLPLLAVPGGDLEQPPAENDASR
jgi:tetratricopeptide (TPR) repeat protein